MKENKPLDIIRLSMEPMPCNDQDSYGLSAPQQTPKRRILPAIIVGAGGMAVVAAITVIALSGRPATPAEPGASAEPAGYHEALPQDQMPGQKMGHIFAGLYVYRVKGDGGYLYGVADTENRVVIQPQYEFATVLSEDRILVRQNGKEGLIDRNNQEVFSATADKIVATLNDSSTGYKSVLLVNSGNSWRLIDMDGAYLNEEIWESLSVSSGEILAERGGREYVLDWDGQITDRAPGRSMPAGGNLLFYRSLGQTGVTDTDRRILISAVYDDMIYLEGDHFIVNKDGRQGLIDLGQNELLPLRDWSIQYRDGFETVIVQEGRDYRLASSRTGEFIGDVWDYLYFYDDSVIYAVKGETEVLLDRQGTVTDKSALEPQEFVEYREWGLKTVVRKGWELSTYGVQDLRGNEILPCEYVQVEVIGENRIMATKMTGESGSLDSMVTYLFDSRGKLVTDITYSMATYSLGIGENGTQVGMAFFYSEEKELRFCFVDRNFKRLEDREYTDLQGMDGKTFSVRLDEERIEVPVEYLLELCGDV